MSDLLIAEELFLLTHHDKSGKAASVAEDAVISGGLLLDLAEHELISIDDAKRVVVAEQRASHPLLADVQAAIGRSNKPRSVAY